MSNSLISDLIKLVDANQLRQNLFSLSKSPLPYRKLNHTVPGNIKNTLYQTDDFIQKKLESWGYGVQKEGVKVRAFSCDISVLNSCIVVLSVVAVTARILRFLPLA